MLNAAVDSIDRSSELQGFSASLPKPRLEPFSLFEEYMLLDDTPEYPMDPVFQLCFNGLLDWSTTRRSLLEIISRHPLLQSCATKRYGRLFWAPTNRLPEIDRVDYDACPEALTASGLPTLQRLDLYSSPGLRVCYVESARERWSRLVFQFHHAVADGIGIVRLLNEWLILYARSIGAIPTNVALPKLDLDALRERLNVGWNLRGYLRSFFDTWRSTRQVAYKLPRPLVRVPAFKNVGLESGYPCLRTLTLTPAETTEYIRRSKAKGVTVNDSLLADFFLAMDRWLTDVKHDVKDGRLRIMAPVNMRTSRHANAPLSNVVSTVFLDRYRRKISEGAEKLLKSVRAEMEWVKDKEQRYDFLLILKALHKVPGALNFFLKLPTCRSTGVLSNLGRVFDDSPLARDAAGRISLGNACLDRIDANAPLRYKTELSIVGLTYAGALNLCMRYDSRLINDEEADRFIDVFRSFLF